MEFGQRLADARKTKNISQEALADALGVSRQAVSKWETGESKPDVGNLIALCDTLELNIEYLCFGRYATPEQQVTKRFLPLWIKMLLYSLTIVLSIILGTILSVVLYKDSLSTEPDVGPVLEELTQRVDIVDLDVVHARAVYNNDKKQYEVYITPNVVNKDLQLMLRIENTNDQASVPITRVCTLEDSDYMWVFQNPQPDVNYRVIAMFKLGETWKIVPVMNVHLQDGTCAYEPLWDSAGEILN